MRTFSHILFGSKYDCKRALKSGWSNPEPGIVWSNAQISHLNLARPPNVSHLSLTIRLKPFTPPVQPYQVVNIAIDGEPAGSFIIRKKEEIILYLQVENSSIENLLEMTLEFPFACRPSETIGSNDNRLLAIAIMEIKIDVLENNNHAKLNKSNILKDVSINYQQLRDLRVQDAHDLNYFFQSKLLERNTIPRLVESYIRNVGVLMHIRRRAADTVLRAAQSETECLRSDLFFNQLSLRSDFVQRHCPEYIQLLFQREPRGDVRVVEILERSSKSTRESELRYANNIRRTNRPSVSVVVSEDSDIVVNPYFSVIYRRSHQAGAYLNIHGVSKFVLQSPSVSFEQHIVLVQDGFDCGNLAHFLFDSVIRIYQYASNFRVEAQDALFILGGWPSEFHIIILKALAEILNLDCSQFFFPAFTVKLTHAKSVSWFTDQEESLHPALLMHPSSVACLKQLASLLGSEVSENARSYISRSDAGLRRLVNEDDLFIELEKYGFKKIVMSDYTYEEQISIVSSSAMIVAPHGMALTHLALHRGKPFVCELFNPEIGSDAYSMLADAYDFEYIAIIGRQVDSSKVDFVVDIEEVVAHVRQFIVNSTNEETMGKN